MTEAELIGDIADALGGAQRLADALQVNRRSVLRWQNGQNAVDPRMWAAIGEVLSRRNREIEELWAATLRFRE